MAASSRRLGSEAELNALEFRYIYRYVALETLPPTQMRTFLDECR